MHIIDTEAMSRDFFPCWQSAGNHINEQAGGVSLSWLRAHPYPPYLEHLSFRIGNQLFFIRVEDADGGVEGPGTYQGLYSIADGCMGHACVLLMKRSVPGGHWVPARKGWGLVDARLDKPVDPVTLVTDEKIEMTRWELFDMAVQVVRNHIEKEGFKLMSWQSNPDVDPSLWFVGKSGGPEWVVVRPATFPDKKAEKPENWSSIADRCAHMSKVEHFASVGLVSPDQNLDSESESPIPLWRGHKMHVYFDGLE
jgi:hypothetical protein